jgi:hypothetical protein
LILVALLCFTSAQTGAQKKKPRPAPGQPQQQTPAGKTTQAAAQKKNITPLRSSDTAEGSRITITSDVPLNDYSAYRNGNRYYVVIPEASAPRAQGSLRGRGFEDVQVQKRGNDTVLSFRLQPGTNARVNQKFNKLDVELTAPGGGTAAPAAANTNTPRTAPTPAATPAATAANNQGIPGSRTQPPRIVDPNTGQVTDPGLTPGGVTGRTAPVVPGVEPAATPPLAAGTENPALPAESAPSPSAGEAATGETQAGAPPEQIAQVQPPPVTQPVTTTAVPSSSGASLGTVLAQNWLIILIAALLLLGIVGLVATRGRAERNAATAGADKKETKETTEDARKEKAVATPAALPQPSAAAALDAAAIASTAGVAVPSAQKQKTTEAAVLPAVEDEQAKEATAVQPADVERAETEVNALLEGKDYDEAVIASTDRSTRQLVVSGLLSALAGRSAERRERAREVFIKHNYLDEATYDLRTADAPAERASAARALGFVRDRSTTPHLIAALADDAPEVRRSAVEALAEMGDPDAVAPLESLLESEHDRKVPRALIERAITASRSSAVETVESGAVAAAESSPLEAEEVTLVTAPEPAATDEVTLETAPAAMAPETAETSPAAEIEAEPAADASAVTAEVSPVTMDASAADVEPQAALVETQAAVAKAPLQEAQVEEPEQLTPFAAEAGKQTLEAEGSESADAGLSTAELTGGALALAGGAALIGAAGSDAVEDDTEARREAEEAAARSRAEEERERAAADARRRADEDAALKLREARQRAEEAERLRLEAERKAEEDAALRRAEEEARLQAEEAASRDEEARLQAEEEEAERLRAAEQARIAAAEEDARRQEEEKQARLSAEQEARWRIEEDERPRAEEGAAAEAAHLAAKTPWPGHEVAAEAEVEEVEAIPVEPSSSFGPEEALLERNDGTETGWFEIEVDERNVIGSQQPTPMPQAQSLFDEPSAVEMETPAVFVEPLTETAGTGVPQADAVSDMGGLSAEAATADDSATADKSIAPADEEFSTVPVAIMRRLGSEEPEERAAAVTDLGRVGGEDSFREISAAFDDPAPEVRNAAARSLFNLNTDRAGSFTRALREAPSERRRKIGAAVASSGLASEAIGQLMGESREKTYDAFSLLFLMSKAGEVQPLMRAIEEHPNNEVRLAVVKLLALSGQQEILPAFRRLAVRGSLPTEVRSAVMEAIYQISSQADASSVAK